MGSTISYKCPEDAVKPSFAPERIAKLRAIIKTNIPNLCLERALIYTRSYKETEGLPADIRRATAFAKLLRDMTIYINEGELIVGNQASKPMAGKIFPELGVNWLEKELETISTRPQDPFFVSADAKKILREEVIPYWKNRCVEARVDYLLPQKILDLENKLWTWSISKVSSGAAHFSPQYDLLLKTGLFPYRKEAQERLEALDFANPDDIKKATFYKSAIIALDAIFDFAHRYAEYAWKLAARESDPQRKFELEQIAHNCEKVPEKPPETYWESLQYVYFIHMLLIMETGGFGPFLGRADQYFYPYYEKDIAAGTLTKDFAQEIMDCWWVKFAEDTCVMTATVAEYFAGFPVWQTVTIGGLKEDGRDATNDLTHMMLNAEGHVRLHQPEFGARVHADAPDDYMKHVVEVIKMQTGKPMLLMDNGLISAWKKRGWGKWFSTEQMRNYTIVGCGGAHPISTRSNRKMVWGETTFINGGYPKYLEYALNNGRDRLTGELIGAKTGDPRKFNSFADVADAYKKQIEYIMPLLIAPKNMLSFVTSELTPCILQSLFSSGCMESGLDCTRGGAGTISMGHYSCGFIDLGDQLAAIKKLVFEDKAITMDKLLNALDANFEGQEDLRLMLLNRSPKFGNDNEYVDKLLTEFHRYEEEVLGKQKIWQGGPFFAGWFTISQNVPQGKNLGATADGRKARLPLADGGASPYQGRDISGPTASMKSVASLPWESSGPGGVFNMRFNPQTLESDENVNKFISLIKAYDELGGWHVQFNVISSDTLKEAQKHPELYGNLMVRVAGFSAFFNQLSKEIQDNIIERTEHQNI